MLKRIVSWLILVPFCLVLVVFALSNRHTVTINFDPLSQTSPIIPPIDVPLFLVIYAVLILGVVLGGLSTWITQGRQRKEKRKWRKQAKKMEQEAKVKAQTAPAAELDPDLQLLNAK